MGNPLAIQSDCLKATPTEWLGSLMYNRDASGGFSEKYVKGVSEPTRCDSL